MNSAINRQFRGVGSAARNIRLYPWFQAFQSLIFWMPIFFLFFSSRLGVAEVLLLEAIYYAFVVLLEVPSGYFSDRFGRRLTLVLSAASWVVSGLLFCLAQSFVVFVVAQALVACGMAFRSGSDSALLYESLKAESRQSEIAWHEARGQAWALTALGLAAVTGGIAAMLALYLPYLLSAFAAVVALWIALLFCEPGAGDRDEARRSTLSLLGDTIADGVLRWLMIFSVALTVLVHIPYELLQPYTGFALDASSGPGNWHSTPLISGLLLAATMLLGAWSATWSVRLMNRQGVGGVLFISVLIIAIIVFAMTLAVHWWILPLLLLRSVAMALSVPIINAALHGRLPDAVRATYLSLQSLLGRLAFSVVLFFSAAIAGEKSLSADLLSDILGWLSALTLLLLPILFIGARILNRQLPAAFADVTDQASE